ncbi:hypothetical protein [Undibacterium aquatile]|uniref:Uncharacterized protein n=1 Tax=Undibacterium aquatile TaxID=1537398 RepID=A0ABR6XJT4_9BURK|nr:hypothetical protein [Undibacterium aquatile]MBC3813174.1 hypothetical protein [Undibacterium aquatile]
MDLYFQHFLNHLGFGFGVSRAVPGIEAYLYGEVIMSFAEDLLDTLGKDARTNEVIGAIDRYALRDVYVDPPFRHYVGSAAKGVDLLFERDNVFDIQIYVQSSKTHSSFQEDLPFQIKSGMTDEQIHILLGEPEAYDEVGSKYTVLEGTAKLTIVYDKSKIVSYLSIRRISAD